MHSPVIVAALRTPIGRARKGSLVTKDAFELAQVVVGAVLDRTKIDPRAIDDLVIAESLQGGGVIARHTAVALGLDAVPGSATNRHCAAGLGAIANAAGSIAAGMDRVVLAGGTESMSTMPMCTKRLLPGADPQLWMSPSHPETPDAPAFDMSITVGHNTAVEAGLTRTDVDHRSVGGVQPRPRDREHRRRRVRFADRPDRGARARRPDAPLRHRRASAARALGRRHGRAQGAASGD
jgi:acetyl-CoA C-acetyltransferase